MLLVAASAGCSLQPALGQQLFAKCDPPQDATVDVLPGLDERLPQNTLQSLGVPPLLLVHVEVAEQLQRLGVLVLLLLLLFLQYVSVFILP